MIGACLHENEDVYSCCEVYLYVYKHLSDTYSYQVELFQDLQLG